MSHHELGTLDIEGRGRFSVPRARRVHLAVLRANHIFLIELLELACILFTVLLLHRGFIVLLIIPI